MYIFILKKNRMATMSSIVSEEQIVKIQQIMNSCVPHSFELVRRILLSAGVNPVEIPVVWLALRCYKIYPNVVFISIGAGRADTEKLLQNVVTKAIICIDPMYTDPDRSPVSFIHGQVHTTIKSALGDIRLQECDNIVLIADWMTPFPKVSPELQAMVEIRPTAIISRTQSDNDYYAAGSLPFVDYLKHHLPLPGRLDAWVDEEVPDRRYRGKKKDIGAFQSWQQNLTEETVLPVYWLVQSQLSMVPYAYRSIFNNEIQSKEIHGVSYVGQSWVMGNMEAANHTRNAI